MESKFIKIIFGENKYYIVGNIYRAPDGDIDKFNESLAKIINTLETNQKYKKSKNTIFLGYININLLNNNTHQQTSTYTDNFSQKATFQQSRSH